MTAREGFIKEVKLMWVLKNGQEFESEKMCKEDPLGMPEKGKAQAMYKGLARPFGLARAWQTRLGKDNRAS